MDSSIVASSVSRLNDKDKAELQQFVTNEQERSRIRSQIHALTDMCWKKCVSGPVKSNTLDRGEETCMANCVNRFLDLNILTAKHLSTLRQG